MTESSTSQPAGAASRATLGHYQRFTIRDGLADDRIRALHRARDGTIWIGTRGGVTTLRQRRFSTEGTPRLAVAAIAEDPQGDLWFGIPSEGVLRLSARGLTTFTADDGLGSPYVVDVFETRDARLAVVTRAGAISVRTGPRFSLVHPRLPAGVGAPGGFLEDSRGDWWILSGGGVFRFSNVDRVEDLARANPAAFYTVRDGLASDDIWRQFEDARGDVWLASRLPGEHALTRWERTTGAFRRYGALDGLPPHRAVMTMAEDRAGQLWVGFWDGGAARLRNGRFEVLPGLSEPVLDWHRAKDGTLWGAALGRGLIRIDHPDAATLAHTVIGLQEGLPSTRVRALTSDREGRLYVGSVIGLTQWNPSSGAAQHYSVEDGLARSEVKVAYRDSVRNPLVRHGCGRVSPLVRTGPRDRAGPIAHRGRQVQRHAVANLRPWRRRGRSIRPGRRPALRRD